MVASKCTNNVIPNQVFLGVPWKNIRKTYEAVIDQLRKSYPISFVIVGRADSQDAEDLLNVIKDSIQSSSFAIFDATDGNANVSLEYGYAEALEIKRALYLSSRKKTTGRPDSPIISDLAGKKRIQYKSVKTLRPLLEKFCKDHPYTKRFEHYMKNRYLRSTRGKKKRFRSLALKIVHAIDRQQEVRRDDVINDLQADVSAYSRNEIDEMIRNLNNVGLIQSFQGRYSKIKIR
jgi:hypothetical protein